MIDSPATPVRPESPVDISLGDKPLLLSQCQSLARSVQKCSKPVIEGSWTNIPDVRGSRVKFIPSDFESAKAFIRNSVKLLPSTVRRPKRSSSDTPVTSRSRPQQVSPNRPPSTMQRIMTCHGCHLVIGGGEHNGSAIGKDKCTLPHSNRCFGGIPENDSWRSCPQGYVSNNGTGFSQTLGLADFQVDNASTPVQASSTSMQMQPVSFYESPQHNPDHSQHSQPDGIGGMMGAVAGYMPEITQVQSPHILEDQVQFLPEQINDGDMMSLSQEHEDIADLHRFHRQANGEGARGKVIQERVASRVSFAGNVDVKAPFLEQHMEQDVAALRAHNQLAPEVSQHLTGEPQLTIGEIRAMQGMSDRVAQMWNDIREQTPCLSAAPNAPAPGLDRAQLSNPAQHQSVSRGMIGTSVGVQQQILDARAKLAAVNEKKKLAEQHLYKQQQLEQQTLQDKGDSDLKSYQRQIQEAEGHLQKVQQAMQNLFLGQSQPQKRLDHPQRRSVLRQVPLSSSHAQPAPPSRTVRQPEQPGFEIVVGADGRQYRVPKSQMSQVPETKL